MRIAWFSKNNLSQQSGAISAYCSDNLLPHLRKRHEIIHFNDDPDGANDAQQEHFLRALESHKRSPFDLFFYHIEDSKVGDISRLHCGLMPGVTWFHDVFLSTHGPEPILNSPWNENILRSADLTREWLPRDHSYFREGPVAQREIGVAAGLISSCPRLVRELNQWRGERVNSSKAVYVPHPVEVVTVKAARAGKIAFCGSPRIEHRAFKVLGALDRIKDSWKELVWLVDASELRAAQALIAEVGLDRVQLVTGRSPASWQELVADAEVAIHLLVSAYGQLGPYLNISMMAGVPSIVSDYAGGEYVPAQLVFKLASGEREELELAATIQSILGVHSRELGMPAREYAEEFFSSSVVAQELESFLKDSALRSGEAMRRWMRMRSEGRKEIFKDVIPDFSLQNNLFHNQMLEICSSLGWEVK